MTTGMTGRAEAGRTNDVGTADDKCPESCLVCFEDLGPDAAVKYYLKSLEEQESLWDAAEDFTEVARKIEGSAQIEDGANRKKDWRWSQFCSSCTKELIESQFDTFYKNLQSDCAKTIRSLLQKGPPRFVDDPHGFPLAPPGGARLLLFPGNVRSLCLLTTPMPLKCFP